MTWDFKAVGNTETSGVPKDILLNESWCLASEDITIGATGADQSTSVIDFLPYGKDWILSVSGSATFASNAAVDIDYCETKDGTFSDMCTTGLSVAIAGTKVRQVIDNSAKGNAPYLKVRLDKTATMTAATTKTVTVQVLFPPKGYIVY